MEVIIIEIVDAVFFLLYDTLVWSSPHLQCRCTKRLMKLSKKNEIKKKKNTHFAFSRNAAELGSSFYEATLVFLESVLLIS